jgi:hypothetical protein
MSRSWVLTTSLTLTASAYLIFGIFGLTAKQPLLSTGTVKYNEAFCGLLHSNILFPDLTVAMFGQDWKFEDLESTQRKGKRRRSRTTIPVTPPPEGKKRHAQPQPERRRMLDEHENSSKENPRNREPGCMNTIEY